MAEWLWVFLGFGVTYVAVAGFAWSLHRRIAHVRREIEGSS